MDTFEITLKVIGTEEGVRALMNHIKEDILPNASEINDKDSSSWSYKIFQKKVQGFSSEDVADCAADYGHRVLSSEEIEEVLNLMEKGFNIEVGMNWNIISHYIWEVIYNTKKGVRL